MRGGAMDKVDQSGAGQAVNKALDYTTTEKLSEMVPGGDYNPATNYGKYAKAAAGGAAAFLPGNAANMFARAMWGYAGGLASEYLGQKTGEFGRLVGNVAPAAGVGYMKGRKPQIVSATDRLLQAEDPAAMAAAQQRANAASNTMNVGGPGPRRATLAQGMEHQSGITALQREVGAEPGAGGAVQRALTGQMPVGQQAIDDLIMGMSTANSDFLTANSILNTGESAIRAPERFRSSVQAGPYAAAAQDTMPQAAVTQAAQNIEDQRRQLNMGTTSQAGRAMTGTGNRATAGMQAPDVPVLEVERLANEARDRAVALRNNPELDASGKAQALGLSGAADELTTAAQAASPSLAQGKDLSRYVTESFVEPMQRSPMTTMFTQEARQSGKGQWDQMLGIFGDGKSDVSRNIDFAAQSLTNQGPEAFPSLAKAWFESKRMPGLEGGRVSEQSLSHFVSGVYGAPNSPQRANFDSIIRGVATAQGADPAAAVVGARRVMDMLEVISRERESIGALRMGGVAQGASSNEVSGALRMAGIRPLWGPAAALEKAMHQRTYEALAQAFTSPNGVQQLNDIAAWSAGDVRLRAYSEALLRASGSFQAGHRNE
jgi:hypothetical protein